MVRYIYKLQLGSHPVAVVQCTYTHNTQNDTETNNTSNNTTIWKSGAVPRLCGFYPGICLKTEKKAWKTLSQGSHT